MRNLRKRCVDVRYAVIRDEIRRPFRVTRNGCITRDALGIARRFRSIDGMGPATAALPNLDEVERRGTQSVVAYGMGPVMRPVISVGVVGFRRARGTPRVSCRLGDMKVCFTSILAYVLLRRLYEGLGLLLYRQSRLEEAAHVASVSVRKALRGLRRRTRHLSGA